MKPFLVGFAGMFIAGLVILYTVDRYLRKPPTRYAVR